jgi:hypothetical protein
VCGAGIPMNILDQAFLSAYLQGKRTREELANQAFEWLQQQQRHFVQDGKPITDPTMAKQHAATIAEQFLTHRVNTLKQLGVF